MILAPDERLMLLIREVWSATSPEFRFGQHRPGTTQLELVGGRVHWAGGTIRHLCLKAPTYGHGIERLARGRYLYEAILQ